MEAFVDWLVGWHGTLGPVVFVLVSVAASLVLCFLGIPWSTDLMVNNAAGLIGKHFGKRYRTLAINASTNNPEAATMAVSFFMGRLGGWATPLGSLFANFYLMFLVAPVLVWASFRVRGGDRAKHLRELFWRERRLVLWHVSLTLTTFTVGRLALWLLYEATPEGSETPQLTALAWIGAGVLALTLVGFVFFDRRLHRKRPELFEEIDEEEHSTSYLGFIIGTAGLIACCWLMNSFFIAWTRLYSEQLQDLVGMTLFTAMHYFLGALITSLPELQIAIRNLRRLKVPDLNTALASATYSNFTNLVLCFLGLATFITLSLLGIRLSWG